MNGRMASQKRLRRRDASDIQRLASIVLAVAIAHAGGLATVAWLENRRPPESAPPGVEIPVEVMSETDASAQAPAAAKAPETRREADAPPASSDAQQQSQPEPAPSPQQPPAGVQKPPPGVIVERPQETDKPQEARKRAASERKPEDAKAFGALAAVAKPPEPQRLPAFIAPQAYFEDTRPKPAPDAGNDNYRARVLGRVAEAMLEPDRPRPKALAIVGFRIDDSGALVSAWLARPSGFADLDAEAIEMVKRAAPFPVPPEKTDRNFAAAIAFGAQ